MIAAVCVGMFVGWAVDAYLSQRARQETMGREPRP